MKDMQRFIEQHAMEDLVIAAGVAATTFLLLYLARSIVARKLAAWAQRSAAQWDDLLADMVSATHNLMLFGIALLVGVNNLKLPPKAENIVDHGFTLILLSQVGLWGHRVIRGWRNLQINRYQAAENGAAAMNYGVLSFLAEAVLWIILILMVLDNFGVNITTLVASLGIGGIAVALAVQNILGDLFASLSIALDKPFVAGDFIIIDTMMGTVKHVGLKTTRIQSLSGEELIFSNADLLKSRIRNYKRMTERRVVFQIGVVFGTAPEKLKRVNEIIREAVQSQSGVRLDRTHFKAIGASSLDFEVVYYVLDPDYTRYMDIQQAINLALMERMQSESISFAFPTQTLHIERARAKAPNGDEMSTAFPDHSEA